MANLPDGTFYKVVGLTLAEKREYSVIGYDFYRGASLQTAERWFQKSVMHCQHSESPTEKRFAGLLAMPRVELRFYQPDGKTYRTLKTWRQDVPCDRVYLLLGRMNRPKELLRLYKNERMINDNEHRAAEAAADELAPFLEKYHLLICYSDDYRAFWHGHNCPCAFQK